MRLDLFLVHNQLATSRTQAQDFIENGHVYLQTIDKKIKLQKPSYQVEENIKDKIFVERNDLQQYVSRAGLKLAGALKHLNLNVQNKVVLDVGQSTGGFTDCLLQNGASFVVGVDVGHGQLHDSLKNKEHIASIEGLNIKDAADSAEFLRVMPIDKFDLIVMDVSFISITKVIPYLTHFLKVNGEYLFLVKPQFECGAQNLDKNGIVKDQKIYLTIEELVTAAALTSFKNVKNYFESEIEGKDGNQEFFIYGQNLN